MIDLHSHILPGLDDGAQDLEDALWIARAAAADGITTIAATPHVREDYPTTSDAMETALANLRKALQREGLTLRVLPGGEIALDQLAHLSIDELRRFGLGGNPSYLLLETPYVEWPSVFADIVARLTESGITPVIGHPERNPAVQADVQRVEQLVRNGALVQVTAAALDGRLGSRARRCAHDLLDAGLAHMIASDAHSAAVREVGLSRACSSLGDDRLADWLTDAMPAAIIGGGPLPARPASSPPRGRGPLGRILRG